MKAIWIVIILLLVLTTICLARPFLVCDPDVNATRYNVSGLGMLSYSSVPAQAGGSIKYDLATLPNGTYYVNVRACNSFACSSTGSITLRKFNQVVNPR
jgi:hypothetical protein